MSGEGENSGAFARPEDRAIAELARAAFLLSRNKLGALIVIEQQSGLKEFCESGTILNAQLSAELLLAIFMPRSPLHDGACVVRESLLEAAACFLPLAEQRLTQGRLGTRHRAAIGLTEQTDAVVVIVSEETGAIRIARQGKLSRPVEEEQRLVKMLSAVTRPARRERNLGNDLVSNLSSRLTSHRAQGKARADTHQELPT
jgi:diadenylate cyclase